MSHLWCNIIHSLLMSDFICSFLQEIETEETNELDSFLLQQPKVQSWMLIAYWMLGIHQCMAGASIYMYQNLRPKSIHPLGEAWAFCFHLSWPYLSRFDSCCLHGGVICICLDTYTHEGPATSQLAISQWSRSLWYIKYVSSLWIFCPDSCGYLSMSISWPPPRYWFLWLIIHHGSVLALIFKRMMRVRINESSIKVVNIQVEIIKVCGCYSVCFSGSPAATN